LHTPHPDILYLREQGCEDSRLFFEMKWGPREKSLENTAVGSIVERKSATHIINTIADFSSYRFCTFPCTVPYQQDRRCSYNVLLWRVREMFIPRGLMQQPDAISVEESVCMAIYCRRQQ